MEEENKNEKLALLEMRTHAAWYLKGVKNGTTLKEKIFKTKNKEEFMNLLEEFERENECES